MITIVDYGMGNMRSVQKIFERLNIPVRISSNNYEILNANKLLLPGVGHFSNAMKKLEKTGLKQILNQQVLVKKTPILGICLGMQLMTKYSEEGQEEGLGWVDAETLKFKLEDKRLKIPHMGWNHVEVKKHTTMSNQIDADALFYFVHSYFVRCNQKDDVLFKSDYGQSFVSGFEKDNIVGVQFHPEKSHSSGMQLIKNFHTK